MSTELVKTEPAEVAGYNLGSLQVSKPTDVITVATSVATPLAELINKKSLFKNISGRKYVYVEGWSTMGAMLGVVPRHVPEQSKRKDDGEYEEVVELVRVMDGMVIGRAAAVCGGLSDTVWKNRPEYARKSMAITRATGKAFRLSFSWIMTLAGYMPTPAEEMDGVEDDGHKPAGNGHDTDAKAAAEFAAMCDRARKWFKTAGKMPVFAGILAEFSVEVEGDLTKDQRAKFTDRLAEAKKRIQAELIVDQHIEQTKKAEDAEIVKAEAEIDAPTTEQEEIEFKEVTA